MLTEPVIHDNDNDESWLTPIRGSFFPEGAPEEERESSVALEEELDHLWKVIVWNDPVNLMSYVVYVLQKIFGHSNDLVTRPRRISRSMTWLTCSAPAPSAPTRSTSPAPSPRAPSSAR